MSRNQKQVLRRELKNEFSSIDDESLHRRSHELSKNLRRVLQPFFKTSSTWTLGAFAAFEFEPLWWLAWPEESNVKLAFPGLQDKQMGFFWSLREELVESFEFGGRVMTPQKGSLKVTPDVLLVPGLAFGKDGSRLGRGKGFYDKYLKNYEGLTLGLCFSEQVKEALMTEAHDQKVDVVVTDTELFMIGQNPVEEKIKWI